MVDNSFNIVPIGRLNNVKKIDPATKDDNKQNKKRKKQPQQHSVEDITETPVENNDKQDGGIDFLA